MCKTLKQIAGGNPVRRPPSGVEQALMNRFGLSQDGRTLKNLINSISESRNPKLYKKAVQFGEEVLKGVGL